jgi:hypothetical protein
MRMRCIFICGLARFTEFFICGLARFTEFFNIISHKRHDFRKKAIEPKMCDLMFSINFAQNMSILRTTGRDMIKNVYWSSFRVRYSFQLVMKLAFSRKIFEKYSNIKYSENLSTGSQVVQYV